jgi:O-antigen chain-terminating methyltransferase
MNHDMVKKTKSLGFVVYETDAMSYISDQKTGSLAAITGFHLVEHIPFDLLIKLFEECYRALSPGGFVLFETPNPQNLIVGACNFYVDPSHNKPIPPELLDFALDSIGFKTKIIPLHPTKKVIENTDDTIKDVMNLIYGPRDYAVVGYKTI